MIVVKIEIWPKGMPQKVRLLGSMVIENDGAGTTGKGNYDVTMTHAAAYMPDKEILKESPDKAIWKRGRVEGHPRKLSPYHLVLAALRACKINLAKSKWEDE